MVGFAAALLGGQMLLNNRGNQKTAEAQANAQGAINAEVGANAAGNAERSNNFATSLRGLGEGYGNAQVNALNNMNSPQRMERQAAAQSRFQTALANNPLAQYAPAQGGGGAAMAMQGTQQQFQPVLDAGTNAAGVGLQAAERGYFDQENMANLGTQLAGIGFQGDQLRNNFSLDQAQNALRHQLNMQNLGVQMQNAGTAGDQYKQLGNFAGLGANLALMNAYAPQQPQAPMSQQAVFNSQVSAVPMAAPTGQMLA